MAVCQCVRLAGSRLILRNTSSDLKRSIGCLQMAPKNSETESSPNDVTLVSYVH